MMMIKAMTRATLKVATKVLENSMKRSFLISKGWSLYGQAYP